MTHDLETAEGRLAALLENAGKPGHCKGCGAVIMWIKHKNGADVPYTAAGLNHFIDCPMRAQFKKPAQPKERSLFDK